MHITRNEKYSHWEHESFEHVQNFRDSLLKLHWWEVHYSNWPKAEQEWSIRPCLAVDSAQWDLGISTVVWYLRSYEKPIWHCLNLTYSGISGYRMKWKANFIFYVFYFTCNLEKNGQRASSTNRGMAV